MKNLIGKFNISYCISVFLISFILLFTVYPASNAFAAQDSGKLDKIKWSYTAGTLEISGRGEMPDFTEQDMAPWSKYNKDVRIINIDKDITYIGKLAFYDFSSLISIELSNKVITIGDMAFAGCSSMENINMPSVEKIGEYAFSRCFKLNNIVLPETLKEIGDNAFYRCESLSYIRIPASVIKIGTSVFAYCSSLTSVVINAPIKELPEWTFYGCTELVSVTLPKETESVGKNAFAQCDSLVNIYHNDEKNKEDFTQSAVENNPDFRDYIVGDAPETTEPIPSIKFENEGKTGTLTKTEVIVNNDVDIITNTITTHKTKGEYGYSEKIKDAKIEISTNISKKDDWDVLINEVDRQLLEQGAIETQLPDKNKAPIIIHIYLNNNSIIYGKVLKQFAGENIILKIRTSNGSCWSLDCFKLKGYDFKRKYDLEYNLEIYEDISKAHQKIIGNVFGYWVDFADRINFPATLEIYIDKTAARQTATFYEKSSGNNLNLIQSVMVSEEGIAYYKMGNINKGKRYLIALNVNGIDVQDVILPDNSAEENDWLENYVPVTEQYEITEVRGFMGLTMKEFTRLLIFGAIGIAFVVFVIILSINFMSKKKALDKLNKK